MSAQQIGQTLIHANDMKHNNLQKRQINDYLIEIVGQINRELLETKKLGRRHLIIEIPYIYDIPNMEQKDSQRIIWTNVIEILQEKSYMVRINSSKGQCKLKITWVTNKEQNIIDKQNRILNQCFEDF